MNKGDLIQSISERTGMSAEEIDRAVMTAFDVIAQQMAGGDSVSIHGFGTFSCRAVPAKRSRDAAGELMWKPARRVPHFRPGASLTSRFAG